MNADIELSLKSYAYIGDAVWELFVREQTVLMTMNAKKLHALTTERVNASKQHALLEILEEKLSQEELDLARRGRNLSIPSARRSNQNDYRQATAFEVLIGWWYVNDKLRLEMIKSFLKDFL